MRFGFSQPSDSVAICSELRRRPGDEFTIWRPIPVSGNHVAGDRAASRRATLQAEAHERKVPATHQAFQLDRDALELRRVEDVPERPRISALELLDEDAHPRCQRSRGPTAVDDGEVDAVSPDDRHALLSELESFEVPLRL